MTSSTDNSWLHRFALLTAAATFCLIWVGGLVTSHGAGMAVPDWPTTYGYNMFFFPISKWVGGIFYEHSHRLVASAVGFLTVILAVWLWLNEERRWLRWLGITALVLVAAQGVLGGLRVTYMKDVLGVFHGTVAQVFLVLVSSIALFTSRWWRAANLEKLSVYDSRRFRYLFGIVTGLILLQLMLGAAMRHQHAGLAIPDFPMAHGKLWPDMDASAVARYNQTRGETTALNPITSFQVGLQMTHRIGAVLILISVAWVAGTVRRQRSSMGALNGLSLLWLGLILVQASLGAATIWTNKAADVATAHVAVGALSLVTGAMLTLMAGRPAALSKAAPLAPKSRQSSQPATAETVQVSA
jgi:cytochrome c oxidase assembly protein subunit 15